MSKLLTFSDANRIITQIKNGEWKSDVRREWDHKPQSGMVYRLSRNGVCLWVANGFASLELSGEHNSNKIIEISTFLKIYLWFFCVGKFIKQEVKAFNKLDAERDYNSLSGKF